MKIKIKEHFDKVKEKHQKLVVAAESVTEKVKNEIALKAQDKSKLEAEKKKKERLLLQNEEAGLDVPKLKSAIQELNVQIEKIGNDLESLQKKERESVGVVDRTFEREDLMVSILNKTYCCNEAVIVDCLEECFKTLPVKFERHDNAGHPQQTASECKILIGQIQKVLKIKAGDKRFLKSFRPQSLQWLPATSGPNAFQELEECHHGERVRVFFESKNEQFIISQKLEWYQHVKQPTYPYENKQIEHKDAFADIAIPLEAKIDELLTKENNELNLEKSYKDNPLLAHVRSEVMAQTSPKPPFKECNERLTSTEIYNRIKADWDLFVNCPWSDNIEGTLALLKYHSENGERARFWSGKFEGQYGFRLRTRDHSWIEGGIYISPSVKTDSSNDSLNMVHYRNGAHSIGRMFLTTDIVRDKRD